MPEIKKAGETRPLFIMTVRSLALISCPLSRVLPLFLNFVLADENGITLRLKQKCHPEIGFEH